MRAALALLLLTTLAAFAWPAYRAMLAISIDPNEGWNAYFADAAMGQMPLYPAPGQFITNNYPPLSFYAVGIFGKLLGDNVLAGRLLSLGAVILLGVAAARIVLALGGNRTGAAVGGIWLVGTMSRFFMGYVGMDDPQLLAHALMAMACAAFVRAAMGNRDCTPAILGMVLAGFFKHNIIAMPAASMLWLALNDRRQFWKCGGYALAAMAVGFGVCRALYGRDFWFNFLTPRGFSWGDAVRAMVDLRFVCIGLLAWGCMSWLPGCKGKSGQFCHLLTGMGLLSFFLQKTGSGVDVNAEFDLVIALSIVVGMVLSGLSGVRMAPAAVALLLWGGWMAPPRFDIYHLLFDRSFRDTISACEKATADAVSEARAAKGDVQCEDPLVCYRSGKPFFVDEFNADERIRAGKIPEDTITSLIECGKMTDVKPEDAFYVFMGNGI